MRYIKIIVFVLMLMALAVPLGVRAQEKAKEAVTAATIPGVT